MPKKPFAALRPLLEVFTPYAQVGSRTMLLVAALEIGLLVLLWATSPIELLPKPHEVWQQLGYQITERGLLPELLVSMRLNLEALAIAGGVAVLLSYGYVVPFVRPIAIFVSGLRYSGTLGWSFVFLVLIPDSHWVKVAVLVFGMLPYMTAPLVEAVRTIRDDQLEHARTLKLGHWGTTWLVVVRGRLPEVLEAVRQNASIGWMMVAMVEGMLRTEGGVGVMMMDQQKYLRLPDVFAIISLIFAVGIVQDRLLRFVRTVLCPYASLNTRSM